MSRARRMRALTRGAVELVLGPISRAAPWAALVELAVQLAVRATEQERDLNRLRCHIAGLRRERAKLRTEIDNLETERLRKVERAEADLRITQAALEGERARAAGEDERTRAAVSAERQAWLRELDLHRMHRRSAEDIVAGALGVNLARAEETLDAYGMPPPRRASASPAKPPSPSPRTPAPHVVFEGVSMEPIDPGAPCLGLAPRRATDMRVSVAFLCHADDAQRFVASLRDYVATGDHPHG